MNLITDKWIPVFRKNGIDKIAPWQIAEPENPVVEINSPRPDFKGALYQFLIGLLQTCFAPGDEDVWEDYWVVLPPVDILKSSFDKVEIAFELDNPDDPAFLQDYDLPEGTNKDIDALLIEAPGEKTLKDNLDHFVKGERFKRLCPSCTATALFTLQTNAPSGGSGQRVGLRGGGPLTTLVLPEGSDSVLWEKLWLNVLSQEDMPASDPMDPSVMPWLTGTRLSEKKGAVTTPSDTHALQMYWGMPRRIRLGNNIGSGECDLCGEYASKLYSNYRTKKHGINFDGPWIHPLTPYRYDPEKKKIPLSLKGQKGGLGYRHWLGLTLQNSESGDTAATIVKIFNSERGPIFHKNTARLWCFGYDMDNMKARCWYDTVFPIFALDRSQRENLSEWATELISAAKAVVEILRAQVKQAWFKRPEDAKGDMTIVDAQFWDETEPDFYKLLQQLSKLPGDTRMAPSQVYGDWFKVLELSIFRIFEKATLEASPEDIELKRIILARQTLKEKFYRNKIIKSLLAKSTHEEATQ